MMELSIKQQITLTLSLVIGALITVGGIGLWKLSQNVQESQTVYADGIDAISVIDTARGAQVDFKKQVQEWKNILLRGNDPKAFKKYHTQFDQQEERVQENLKRVKALTTQNPALVEQINTLLATHQQLGQQYRSALKHYQASNQQSAQIVDKLVRGIDRQPTDQMDQLIETIRAHKTSDLDLSNERQVQNYDKAFNWFVATIVLCTIGVILLTIHLVHTISRQLARAMTISEHLAQGDLTYTIDNRCSNELGRLIDSSNTVSRNLTLAVTQIAECASEVSNASQAIASENTRLADRTLQQATALEETARNMRSISSGMQDNAEFTSKAKKLVSNARNQATDGAKVVGQVMTAMDEIKTTSTRISDINNVIDEIAFQTNLLALNAAVEAARAGEQGRGFAVVAGEVRALAQRSAAAAKEIKELISDAVDKVSTGSHLANESGARLQDIVTTVNNTSSLITDIAAATEEQAASTNEVNNAITEMDNVTQQNTMLVEQVAESGALLETNAMTLQDLIKFFTFDPTILGEDATASASINHPEAGHSHNAREERRKSGRPWSEMPAELPTDDTHWQQTNGY